MQPQAITFRQKERVLDVSFDDGQQFSISCEFLRVNSPSAEVQGHGGPKNIPTGKENVTIVAIEPVGNYAIKIIFDDGHDSGIYSWETLYDLGKRYTENDKGTP
ncbi:MAG: hypothetical protein CMF50_04945 [Legionellales bacterium]|nr:hypothetical protein [Legionellales bacterium]|tara:strand:+ start:37110 stop:37421 length:312 start_codon:yes stop_codon:yes gene_type:complete